MPAVGVEPTSGVQPFALRLGTPLAPVHAISLNRSLGIFGSLATHRIYFNPASHPATPAPFGASSGPVAFYRRSLRTSDNNPGVSPRACPPQFLGGQPRTPCRNRSNIRPAISPGYVGSPFGALPFTKRPPRLFMCLLALCHLGCALRSFGLFTRPDPAPPRIGSAAPGHNPARGPFASF